MALTTVQNQMTAMGNSGASYEFVNRIINGAMVIDQRNAGASITPTGGAYTVDRWAFLPSQSSKLSIQQNAGAVTPPTGFTNYLGLTSTSSYSVTASDYFLMSQAIEGLNVGDLAWGTSSASPATLSFWVRSSLTGTFGGSITNSGYSYCYPFTYTISSANTWEYKTVSISGPTSGTWLKTNGTGLQVILSAGAGATVSGTAGAWAATAYYSATGAQSVVGTNGATLYFTGVQLEKGTTASAFDFRDYTRELIMCQRYYEIISMGTYSVLGIYSPSGVFWCGALPYQVVKRTTPTFISGSVGGAWAAPGSFLCSGSTTSFTVYGINQYSYCLSNARVAGNTTPTNGNVYAFEGQITASFNAEL